MFFIRSIVLTLFLFSFLACNTAASRDGGGSEVLSIGSPYGQVPAVVVTEYESLLVGDEVCVASFEEGLYKIYSRKASVCDRQKKYYVPSYVIEMMHNAYSPWLVNLEESSSISLDMRYAFSKIFPNEDGSFKINQPLYGKPACLLHPSAKENLEAAARILERDYPQYILTLLDCYRPAYVSKIMFDKVPDPIWVAPKSSHNKGGAVDLTLSIIEEGEPKQIDMGSPFDLFSSKSNYSPSNINHTILRKVMVEAGFSPYDAEWWHFRTDGHEEYLDLPL